MEVLTLFFCDSVVQNNLGFMYDRGTGVPEDDTKAVNWY